MAGKTDPQERVRRAMTLHNRGDVEDFASAYADPHLFHFGPESRHVSREAHADAAVHPTFAD